MRWLIFGHTGWIGSLLCALLGEECIKATSRADNMTDVLKEIEQTKPDRVVSAIGRTQGKNFEALKLCSNGCNRVASVEESSLLFNGCAEGTKELSVDYLEDKLPVNLRDNLYGPLVLAEACKRNNIHLTYFGTGCIFKYDDTHTPDVGFNETDEPNFFGSAYSCVKGTTDKIMRNMYNNTVLNLRIRMPFSSTDSARNFISKIIRYEKVINVKNSMTSLDEILPIVIDMAKQTLVGTYNMTHPGTISHSEILDMYREIVDNNFTYTLMNEEEQNKINEKRSNNYLCSQKLESLYKISSIHDAIHNALLTWKKN